MRKFLLPLIIVGVLIGGLSTIKDILANREVNEEVINEVVAEVYIDELNLPLIEVDTLNPLLTHNKQVADILKLIYEPLFDFNEENKIEPILASNWSEKDDLTWLVKVNKNANWHGGKPFIVEDVIFTYNAIQKTENSVYKENIKNIISIEKLDEDTIQINLSSKDKLLPYKLTFPIIPKYYFDLSLNNEEKNSKPIGTGPYKYDSKISENLEVLVFNDKWWRNEPNKLNKIYLYKYPTYGEAIKAFKSAEIDVIPTSMASWQKKFGIIGIHSYMYENSEFETLIVNTKNKILNESSVRRAILSAINTERIIEEVYNGNGMLSSYPIQSNSYLNYCDSNKNYNIEKARKLLTNAEWYNESGVWKKVIENKTYTLEFDLLVDSQNEEKLSIAELIATDLKELDIKVNLVKVKTEEYKKRIMNDKFELALTSINLDMDTDILELLETASEKNYSNYENIYIDNNISKINMDNLELTFEELYNIYKNELPYISLYYKCNNLLTNKSVKGNIKPTSWNVYHNITGWCK